MEYRPKEKEQKATKAIYIRTRLIDEVEKICRETGLSFSAVVDDMIETCVESRKKKNQSER